MDAARPRRADVRERALQIGLISEVVPREDLLPHAHELAAIIAAKPPYGVTCVRSARPVDRWERSVAGFAMARLAAAWGRPALPRCSTTLVSSATTIVIGCPPVVGSAVASVFEGRPARMLAGTPVAGADRG